MRNRNKTGRIAAGIICLMVVVSMIVSMVVSMAVSASAAEAPLAAEGTVKASAKAADDSSVFDKIKKKLSEIDRKAEKEKFREAVQMLDEKGISPEKLVQRAGRFLGRKDNKERIENAFNSIRQKIRNFFHRESAEEVGKMTEQVTKEMTEKASEKVEEAADRLKEEAKKKAAEEILKNF